MPADGSPGAAWMHACRARAFRVPFSRASPRATYRGVVVFAFQICGWE